ncbi:hypothetical protein RJ639_045394 [Escallonia herrerae]|uniref:PRA1 family protein n=1 Tax=Escallonia herrerae TaxID=1293975 RepID=A0AA88W7A6_9ASTE|nr:hypothetical protein RJ639_045394 [Escallonia herrerae]
MSSSHKLPVSNPQTATSTTVPFATPAIRAFLTRTSDSLRRALSRRSPWHELADPAAFSRPDSLSDAASRVRNNLSYFRINYLALLAAVLALSLLLHPFSLLALLCLLAAWFFLYLFRPSDQPVVVFSRTFSDRETLGVLTLLTVVLVFLTNVGSLLISATLIGLGIVCVHGAFRAPEDLFLDVQEAPGSGLFSILGGSAAATPAVASRV